LREAIDSGLGATILPFAPASTPVGARRPQVRRAAAADTSADPATVAPR
jgi:hypothetical protein